MSGTGRYIYAVSRDLDLGSMSPTAGLRAAPLSLVEHRGLSAVVSDVDLDEFGEEGLRRNLEDLAWLEEVARGHDAVVQAVAAVGPTAPLRLATICHDDEGVRSRLDDAYDALQHALDRVEGRMEWSVKAYGSPANVPDPEPVEESTDQGAGAAYLRRKRTQTVARQTAEGQAVELAEKLHDAMAGVAVASRRLQPQDPRLTGHQGTMTLNGAYLVPVENADEFAARARALADEHPESRIEVFGPWPPYSFATLEQP